MLHRPGRGRSRGSENWEQAAAVVSRRSWLQIDDFPTENFFFVMEVISTNGVMEPSSISRGVTTENVGNR